MTACTVGILGGSGLYELAGIDGVEEVRVDTAFGAPSSPIRLGRMGTRPVAFLARHGPRHQIPPSAINYRANILALKQLGVDRILSASAVGSMQEEIRPRDVVVPDQFIDRTRNRVSSFFCDGPAVHVSFADPVCRVASAALASAARAVVDRVHHGGTYLCMEGPAFSTRAESRLYRSWGVDVIGMTNLQEAKLAREAEICYATLAMATDYDCWRDGEDPVSVNAVISNLKANADAAAAILRGAVEALPEGREGCDCAEALQYAIITPIKAIPGETRERLRPILDRFLDDDPAR